MTISLWELLITLSRISLYMSLATTLGGLFATALLVGHSQCAAAIRRYIFWGCLLGILTTLAGLCVQVGALADEGMAGMMDFTIMSILLKTSVGTAAMLQLMGFLFIGIANYRDLKIVQALSAKKINANLCIAMCGGLSLLASFSQVGHLPEESLLGKIAITFHVLAMSLWMGSLYPLWLVSRTANLSAIQQSMERFGQLAAVIVGVQVACGILMASILLRDFHELFFTTYGRGLLLKLALVSSLLLLAASNKWFTVPRLLQPGFSTRLSRAILLEMCVGAIILSITAVITIIIGIS
jgi:copper resistance protein D